MRCTRELLQTAGVQTLNPCGSRTFTLRENLGVLGDAYETLDFSENQITELGGFAPMPHVKFLNKIRRVSDDIAEMLPNLESLVLTGNLISEPSQLAGLSQCNKLRRISLISNPIETLSDLESVLLQQNPSLKMINFQKVKPVPK